MSPTSRILVVEDDKKTSAFLAKGLREAEFTVDLAEDGVIGLELAWATRYDLLIVDVMLPKKDGWSLVADLRGAGVDTPVLFLTARDSIADRVKGFELGADDYLAKPFAFLELKARVRSLLRRPPVKHDEVVCIGDLEIDTARHRASRAGIDLQLTPKEFLLLRYLARAKGEVVARTDIVQHVWDIHFDTNTNIVDVMMRRLRAKVDDQFEKKLIQTIRGVGYLLNQDREINEGISTASRKPAPAIRWNGR